MTDNGFYTICLLPWLRLDVAYECNGICLVPFQLQGDQDANLNALKPSLENILASYVHIRGQPIDRCTIVTIKDNDPEWNIDDSDHERITESLACFFLAAFSRNNYFAQHSTYINASALQPVFQRLRIPLQGIALQHRRRDGSVLDGGYDHGDVKFSIPLECKSLRPSMDPEFLNALGKAIKANTPFVRRLLTSLSFLRLANTDQAHMSLDAEVILMGSSFEQLFDANNKYNLTCKYGEYFSPFKSKTVADALPSRPGIRPDAGMEEENKTWQLGRKFIQELYDLRSAIVHGDDRNKRSWGWNIFEHLLMGAYIYPLATKLLLQEEKHYVLTDRDKIACKAIDILLSKTDWPDDVDEQNNHSIWQEGVSEAGHEFRSEKLAKLLEEGFFDKSEVTGTRRSC